MEEPSALDADRVVHFRWTYGALGSDELKELAGRADTLEREAVAALDEVLAERGLPRPEVLARRYRGVGGFFTRHFRGDYGLARSFWLHVTVFSNAASYLFAWMLPAFGPAMSATQLSLALLLGIASVLALWTWGVVGAWRSSNKHAARGGSGFWAGAAKLVILLALLRQGSELVGTAPVLWEHLRVAFGRQPGEAVEFVVRVDGRSLLLRGGINDHTADGLEEALRGAPGVKTVVLESNGGWIRQGRLIGEVIARRGLDTYVETECTSACTIAFLAGKDRAIAPGARLGFHAFRGIGKVPSLETERAVYGEAGLGESFIRRVANTPHESVWYPGVQELLDQRVVTRRSLGGETAAMATTTRTRDEVRDAFLRRGSYALLNQHHPERFDAIVDAAWRALQQKRIDREVLAAARRELTAFTRQALLAADDATILSYVILLADQAEQLRTVAPDLCVELVFRLRGEPLELRGLLPASFVEREEGLFRSMIKTGSPRHVLKPTQAEVDTAVRALFARMRPADVRVVQGLRSGRFDAATTCKAGIALMDTLLEQGPRERAKWARLLFASVEPAG